MIDQKDQNIAFFPYIVHTMYFYHSIKKTNSMTTEPCRQVQYKTERDEEAITDLLLKWRVLFKERSLSVGSSVLICVRGGDSGGQRGKTLTLLDVKERQYRKDKRESYTGDGVADEAGNSHICYKRARIPNIRDL